MRYIKKYYVSDYWNKGIKGHLNYHTACQPISLLLTIGQVLLSLCKFYNGQPFLSHYYVIVRLYSR